MKQKIKNSRGEDSFNSFLEVFPDKYTIRQNEQSEFITQIDQDHKTVLPLEISKKQYITSTINDDRAVQNQLEGAYQRALSLVQKMNQQRLLMKVKKQKMNQKLFSQVKQSLKKLGEMDTENEKYKQQKRQKIVERMKSRKKKHEEEKEYNQLANYHIGEMKQRESHLPLIRKYSNPTFEKYQNLSLKKYRKSAFMNNLEHEEEGRKNAILKKQSQKNLFRLKQKAFSDKYGTKRKSHFKQ